MFPSRRVRLVAITFLVGIFVVVGLYQAASIQELQPFGTKTLGLTRPAADQVLPVLRSDIDWSRFAYGQYVTNNAYLCNSVMFFAKLHQLGSQADRVMMYPSKMLKNPAARKSSYTEGQLLIKARDEYGVKLSPVEVQHKKNHDGQ